MAMRWNNGKCVISGESLQLCNPARKQKPEAHILVRPRCSEDKVPFLYDTFFHLPFLILLRQFYHGLVGSAPLLSTEILNIGFQHPCRGWSIEKSGNNHSQNFDSSDAVMVMNESTNLRLYGMYLQDRQLACLFVVQGEAEATEGRARSGPALPAAELHNMPSSCRAAATAEKRWNMTLMQVERRDYVPLALSSTFFSARDVGPAEAMPSSRFADDPALKRGGLKPR